MQSRKDNAGVLINLGVRSPSFIRAKGCISETFTITWCNNMRFKTCPKQKLKRSVTNKTYQMINHTGEHLN